MPANRATDYCTVGGFPVSLSRSGAIYIDETATFRRLTHAAWEAAEYATHFGRAGAWPPVYEIQGDARSSNESRVREVRVKVRSK